MYEGLKGLLYGSQYRKFIDQEMGEIEKKYGLNRVDIQILFYLYRAGDESPYQEHLLEICRQKLAGESGITLMEPILNL